MSESPLRAALEAAASESGLSMKDLTVMAAQTDPFRLDSPSWHRDGKWLADVASTLGLGSRQIHTRGLHYMILGKTRPDGSMYVSDDECWSWLEKAAKAARWLGYIPFGQIIDQRNTPPTVRVFQEPQHRPYIHVGVEVDIPDADDLVPTVGAYYMQQGKPMPGFGGVQPYKLVLVGEKSSLDVVLAPIAQTYKADLYLPSGDISDTMVHQMAKVGAEDDRPMVVLYFADADPPGWNMSIAISRKLHAFKILHFPHLDFEVHRVALTPAQVREFGLPSTPLKATEKRAGAWFDAFGVEQTEIDALATLQPDLLRALAHEAIAPFYDKTLDRRALEAYTRWEREAQAALDATLDPERLALLRVEAERQLSQLREQIDDINRAMRVDVGDVELPPIDVPEAQQTQGSAPVPLFDSSWSFVDSTRRLIASRSYQGGTK